ncbi:putative secreted protein [Roseiarcus fermentans]|uniref:Putative secreted protein n=1 Tax=Roseiarcus fermentans TaxID=1473586 RepID=A0A366FDG5_9HYPH|nr:protease inhibitor I42 family protein [Roseiarcus fermentans]RBP11980.1 putative secreted protein [Roseiarcus fermentans]
MRKATRAGLLTLALGAMCASIAAPLFAQGGPAIRLAPGEIRALILPENPSTGYAWAIDAAASRGLDIVAIADDGRRSGGDRPGAPGERLWSIRGLSPGHADIVFVYRRAWEPAAVETRHVAVDVAR